jgi:hypothetical protein
MHVKASSHRLSPFTLAALVTTFLLTALFSVEVDPNVEAFDANFRQSAAAMDASLESIAQYLPGGFRRNDHD